MLDPGNMEGDQLSQSQGHLAVTVWMLLYEVVGCLDEYDKCSIGTPDCFILCAHSLLVFYKRFRISHTPLLFTVLQHTWCIYIGHIQIFSQYHEDSPYTQINQGWY